jgi:hypothetical protein
VQGHPPHHRTGRTEVNVAENQQGLRQTIPWGNTIHPTENGLVVDVMETDEMNREIQTVSKKGFDLSMSAPITMSSLRTKLGFLSDTDFANNLLTGNVHIP